MVRFIAAITVVSVCLCSSAVQAQEKPSAKRQATPVSRAQQVDDARSREQKDNSGADPGGGIKPLSPELEQLLIDWAASSQKIQRLEGEHLRRIYDMVYEIEEFSQGRFYYETPDKGRINITPVPVTPQMMTARAKEVADAKAENRRSEVRVKQDGTPFDPKSDDDECWACDGQRVFELDVVRKEARVAQLPADMKGENIMDSPLPFLFGMPPEKAKLRFEMSLLRPIDPRSGKASLHILPRLPQDAGNWASADVILDLKTFLPIAVQLVDPAGTKITVYSFSGLKVNERKWLDKLFDKQDPRTRFTPDLRGYNVNSSDASQPDQMADADPQNPNSPAAADRDAPPKKEAPRLVNVKGMFHSDAVIQLQRQGLKYDSDNKEANGIILSPGPVAEKEEDIYTVKSQDPPAGTPLQRGMKVQLTLWTMPDGKAKQ